jgi:hypothetical protein
MEAKHTPGPWRVNNNVEAWEPWADAIEVCTDDEVICFTGGRDADRQKINARLIAAAPDMLEALKGVRRVNRKSITGIEARAAWIAVSEAIAKATGGDE